MDETNGDRLAKEISEAAIGLGYATSQLLEAVRNASELLATEARSSLDQVLSDLAASGLAEEPPKEEGFVCVHEGTDTWLARGLYEARQREWLRAARAPQRRPTRPVTKRDRREARRQRRRC